MKKVRLSVTVDAVLYEKLLALAEVDKRSLSALVNYLLYRAVED